MPTRTFDATVTTTQKRVLCLVSRGHRCLASLSRTSPRRPPLQLLRPHPHRAGRTAPASLVVETSNTPHNRWPGSHILRRRPGPRRQRRDGKRLARPRGAIHHGRPRGADPRELRDFSRTRCGRDERGDVAGRDRGDLGRSRRPVVPPGLHAADGSRPLSARRGAAGEATAAGCCPRRATVRRPPGRGPPTGDGAQALARLSVVELPKEEVPS